MKNYTLAFVILFILGSICGFLLAGASGVYSNPVVQQLDLRELGDALLALDSYYEGMQENSESAFEKHFKLCHSSVIPVPGELIPIDHCGE